MNEFIERGQHRHLEAFCLMWYECRNKECGHRELIWNSRDGVTPFAMGCSSCGEPELFHLNWKADVYAPNHKLHYGQKFWRDGTLQDALDLVHTRIESVKGTAQEYSAEAAEELLRAIENGDSSGFQPGWPMLDVKR